MSLHKIADMINGYTTMEMLEGLPDHIIPDHDPLVMKYYPTTSKDLEDAVTRLNVNPVASD